MVLVILPLYNDLAHQMESFTYTVYSFIHYRYISHVHLEKACRQHLERGVAFKIILDYIRLD